jgi:SOS-response transcriptional repressor LexA
MTTSTRLDSEAADHITKWMQTLGIERHEASKLLGVTKQAVSNWEYGINEPKRDIYARMADKSSGAEKQWFLTKIGLSVNDAEVLAGTASDPVLDEQGIEIKVFKSAGAGSFRSVGETLDHTVVFPRAWLPTTQKLIGLVVEGDSMSPLIETGFIVIVDLMKNTKALAVNHIVAASDGDGVAIRYLIENGGTLWLQPHKMNADNHAVPVGRDMRIIGVVVKWIGQPKAGK